MANTSFQSQAIEDLVGRSGRADRDYQCEFDPRLVEYVEAADGNIPVFLKATQSKVFPRIGFTSIALYSREGPSLMDQLKNPDIKTDGIGIRNTYMGVLLTPISVELLEVPFDQAVGQRIETPGFLVATGLSEQILQGPYAGQDRQRKSPAGTF